jgi:hypothetical protein
MRRRRRAGWLALVVLAALAAAATAFGGAIVNQKTPFTHLADNGCTGESVVLSGTMHTVVHSSTSGDRVHFGEDVHLTGMKGATPTGVQYVEMDVQNTQANVTALGQLEITAERTMNLTRQGEDKTFGDGDDLRMHVIAHMTLNANGVPTVDKVDSRSECR